ncbi:NAD(P)-binding protein [Annulohypoxylon maeteangense]|uniref:NAD(P)-binding protein n=1 Tax=Annulohypoxylon maeteangense TaxID=1927788 RepID=UPI0020089178|nr:NAD(P)-binding protein [Annulohypoxylon maeteangense]KAI0886422.1 NAD(P)-binding protein [Annulohypoxylon maeteangense]
MLNWPSWVPVNPTPLAWTTLLVPATTLYFAWRYGRPISSRRQKSVRPIDERVVIIGASSGLGRVIAKRYAARGAHVCIVSRRAEQLAELAGECGEKCFWVAADFSDVGDMVRAREELLNKWGSLDTLCVCAGVSAVQPVMSLAGVEPGKDDDAGDAGIRHAVDIAARATQGNVYGPLVAALTFIPMLLRTSVSPSILLISSVAAIIPAPTRALYAATKASSLLLFQSLAIEHPKIAFTFVLPGTIQGNFRASAVDADVMTREAGPNQRGLKLDYVADRCVGAVDQEVRGNLVIPKFPYAIAHHLYYLWPFFIEKQARKKYNFGG